MSKNSLWIGQLFSSCLWVHAHSPCTIVDSPWQGSTHDIKTIDYGPWTMDFLSYFWGFKSYRI